MGLKSPEINVLGAMDQNVDLLTKMPKFVFWPSRPLPKFSKIKIFFTKTLVWEYNSSFKNVMRWFWKKHILNSSKTTIICWRSKTIQLSFFIDHQYFGQNLEKFLQKIMGATTKSSTYGALHPKPCVALKNLIDHFVPYTPLN